MREASSQTPIHHPADLGGFLKLPSLACLAAARRWHTSWPVCLGRADKCQTEQKWLWAQLYPSPVLALAGGWGLPACSPACLLLLQAEGLEALMASKDKGFFRIWTFTPLLATTVQHGQLQIPRILFGLGPTGLKAQESKPQGQGVAQSFQTDTN